MTSEEKSNLKLEYYRTINEQISFFQSSISSMSDNIGKTILTFSSAIIGFSVAFLDKIYKDASCASLILIIVSWSVLLLSILLVLASYFYGINEFKKLQEYSDQAYSDYCDALDNNKTFETKEHEIKDVKTVFIRVSAILFFLCIVSFVFSSSINIIKL